MPPGGLPDSLPRGRARKPLGQLVAPVRAGPRAVHDRRGERALRSRRRGAAGRARARRSKLVRGELRPGGTEREWCDPDVLRRLRRASLAALRREVEPVEQAALARFLPGWHGIDRRATLREALVPLQALPLPVSLWESEVLPRRVPNYRPRSSTSCARPARSSGSAPGSTGSRSTSARTPPALGRPAAPSGPRARCTIASARRWAAARSSGSTCSTRRGLDAERRCRRSGSSSGRARSRTTPGRRCARAAATASRGPSAAAAFLAPAGDGDHRDPGPVVADRPAVRRASPTGARWPSCCSSGRGSSPATASARRGSPAATAPSTASCKALETLGLCRRGYFVEGLGGAQFALGGAVERLRELRPSEDEPADALVLAAADPAQPYGAALPWPKRAGARAARVAGAYVVLLGGEAALFVERGGRTLVPLRDPDPSGCGRRSRRSSSTSSAARREAAGGRALRRRAGRRRPT